MQIAKNSFIKAHEEGADYQKALMIYRNTPFDDNLLSPMQLLNGRAAQLDLPMSYAAKVKYCLASDHSLPPPILAEDKNERAPIYDYKLNQDVIYLDPKSKKWFLATIVHLLDAKSYLIKTPEGVEYRHTQQHLKPYKPKVCHPPPAKSRDCALVQGRPKHDTKAPDKLDL